MIECDLTARWLEETREIREAREEMPAAALERKAPAGLQAGVLDLRGKEKPEAALSWMRIR